MGTATHACFLLVLPLLYVCLSFTRVCSSVSPTSTGHALFLNPSSPYNAKVGSLRLRGGEDGSVRAGGDSGSSPPVPRGFMQRFLIKDVFASESLLIGTRLVVCGWARTIRLQGSGKFAFLELNDGSCFKSLQVFADPNTEGWQELVKNTHAHTSWRVTGKLVESPGSGQSVEVQAEGLQLLGSCSPDSYPLAKARLPLDFLRTIPHLRPRSNTYGAASRIRSTLAFSVHKYFQEHGFQYVADTCYTPENRSWDYNQDFFKRPTFLTVSGQLQVSQFACASTTLIALRQKPMLVPWEMHLAEFWMIEPEMAFSNLQDVMENAEGLLKFVLKELMLNVQRNEQDLNFFDNACQKGMKGFSNVSLTGQIRDIIEKPFVRLAYGDAIDLLQRDESLTVIRQSGKKFEMPAEWGNDLATEHEKYLCEEHFGGPVIVYDYPMDIKAFYMRLNDDDKTVAAMDILFPRCGEMVGGSQREERIDRLLGRIEELGLDGSSLEWYNDLRRFGGVPHAGYGLGFDRLVQFATGLENIRDVIPFPRATGHAMC
ncbi:asparaginyl-tRNA synthetase [Guillardia theta CCMP2712]|uniref:asparagine--tRNA ligase n=1 Tax=Guillardia theta (strain CCMP2712) TaxID=905079 RepID=L1JMK9_GUITC|nr:asparaginyl-tRNA synthetase [Guillardia theta CCMP2712]EKX49509.1 asparaginyl-tRNA synthetase [Guillardia theta CCMP2712]|eukprot:XP_005836489.1 asparaginyl-tRNA synthetase [Guillardia theta CCMP2712]